MTPVRQVLIPLLLLLQTAAFETGCSAEPTTSDSEDGLSPSDSDTSFAGTDGISTTAPLPCAFADLRYSRIGEKSLDYIIAEDPNNADCRFAFHFAERLGDQTVADIAQAGDTAEVYDIPGFMVATVDFTCNANSTFRCTADTGEIKLITFEITADDLMNDTVSGKAVRIDVNARGTKPGNQAQFSDVIEGVLQ